MEPYEEWAGPPVNTWHRAAPAAAPTLSHPWTVAVLTSPLWTLRRQVKTISATVVSNHWVKQRKSCKYGIEVNVTAAGSNVGIQQENGMMDVMRYCLRYGAIVQRSLEIISVLNIVFVLVWHELEVRFNFDWLIIFLWLIFLSVYCSLGLGWGRRVFLYGFWLQRKHWVMHNR